MQRDVAAFVSSISFVKAFSSHFGFQLSMGAGFALHAAAFPLAVRAGVALLAAVFHLTVRARVTLCASVFLLSVRTLLLSHSQRATTPRARRFCTRRKVVVGVVAFELLR